jgi:hypothetical protein
VNRGEAPRMQALGEAPASSDEGPPGARGTREKA